MSLLYAYEAELTTTERICVLTSHVKERYVTEMVDSSGSCHGCELKCATS